MTVTKEEVLGWLTGTDEKSGNLVDIPWHIKNIEKYVVLENEKIPFSIFLLFDENVLRIFLKTGIETAVLENQERLGTYRILLLLNRQLDLVKFMLEGMHEEVISRVDLEMDTMSKNELNEGLNMLLSSLYLMVQGLKMEEELQMKITERMLLMVQDMIKSGKNKNDIQKFLVEKIGLSKSESEGILSQLIETDEDKRSSGMYA